MKLFRDLPLGRKLLTAFLGTSLVALLVACGTIIAYERAAIRQSLVRQITVLADTLGRSSTAALSFSNREDAEETLQALRLEPSVELGCLFAENGTLFATYPRNAEQGQMPGVPPDMDGEPSVEGDHVMVFRPVILDGSRVGVIFLKASLERVNERIRAFIGIAGLVLVGALLLALVISAGLQRVIARPVRSLAAAAKLITENRDYSVRAEKQSGDELGMLTDSFNQMLEEIQERDGELVKTNDDLHQQVDARIRAEQQLKQLNEQLEARVAARTIELQRSNDELGQFAYVASHDLQEPLRMVSSYVQLLERRYKGRLDEGADQYIGFAVDGAKRMQSLIQDLLTFSRVGTKGRPFEKTDCEAVLSQVLNNLQIAIDESAATISHDPLPTVMGDGMQLTQLLQNLISNALKFRGAEPPKIHIAACREKEEWRLSVSDNGIGIDSQFFDKIFVIFQRLHTREEYPGTGIGLAVCRKIVERHGGRIWVESAHGQGTTFHFTLQANPTTP